MPKSVSLQKRTNMQNKLTRKELRIIEETKREGAAQREETGKPRKNAAIRSFLFLAGGFVLVVLLARLLMAWIGAGK